MGVVNDLIKDMPLPRMARVRQHLHAPCVADVEGAVRRVLRDSGVLAGIKRGMRLAVTAGSRGIANIALITATLIDELRRAGAEPFVVAAMGSHGGATDSGQLEVLRGYGLTEERLRCPVVSSMRVEKIGDTSDGRPILIDAAAAAADGIVVANRVKPHTSFTGPYESGLMKMLAIGLAKQAGAETCHQEGYGAMAANIEKYGREILRHANVVFGLAMVENAHDQTCAIAAMRGDQIPKREPELLRRAKAHMPRIPFGRLDVLIVDWMGKNISGLGMDPHITGSFASPYASGPPRPDKLVVLDLTPETHGNANGIGCADVTTRRLFAKFDPETTYPNALTATLAPAVRLPMIMDNQRLAIQAGIKMAAGFDKRAIRLIRLSDTLHLDEFWISESLLAEARGDSRMEVLGGLEELRFDANGDLFADHL